MNGILRNFVCYGSYPTLFGFDTFITLSIPTYVFGPGVSHHPQSHRIFFLQSSHDMRFSSSPPPFGTSVDNEGDEKEAK